MGSHVVYNCWYNKSHMLADITRRKSQINKLKHTIQCVKYWRWNILYVSCTVMWWFNHVHYKMSGISQSHSMWSKVKLTRNHTLFKNSYSRVCIVYKNLAPKLTYADIRNIRNVFFVSRTSIYVQSRIGYDMVSLSSGCQRWIYGQGIT